LSDDDLDSAVDQYIDELRLRAPLTRSAYTRDLRQFVAYCREHAIEHWRAVDAQGVRNFVATRHRHGISARSLQRALAALRGFFDFLQTRAVIDHNPVRGIRAPKAARKLPHVLDVDQSARLVDLPSEGFHACRDRALLELIYSSGLRVSEAVSLTRVDLDLQAGEVRVNGKGDKCRIVPVGRHALTALNAWLLVRQTVAKEGQDALFVNRTGQRLTTRAVQLRCAHWGVKQGIDVHVHPHMLRHSFASHVLESSGDLRAVQELLGHADIRTTQVYTHLDFQHLAKVYDAAHPRARRKGTVAKD
jgi:integrase/recombinase XerC